MRFVLGLAVGATVVLAVAEGLAGADWQDRLNALGDYLQHRIGQPTGPGPPGAAGLPETVVPPRIERKPSAVQETAARTSTEEEPAREPMARPPDLQPVETQPVETQPAERKPAETQPVEQVADAGPPKAPAAPSSQAVWVAFHSQMSATGFAERLTETLDHPFRVERRGPGRYQVVFSYADEPERQALLAQAVEATGLPL